MRNILIVGSSGQASLSTIKCLRLANIKKQKYNIITSDIDPLLIGAYVGDRGYLIRKEVSEWIDDINKIVAKEDIDLIIVAHDIPLEILSFRKNEVDAEILLPPDNVLKLARDKFALANWLRENKFPYPKTWKGSDVKYVNPFPVITKPRGGFGSRMVFDCSNQFQLQNMIQYSKEHGFENIIQEKLDGTELSAMATVAKDGEILSITCAESVKKFGMSYKTIHGGETDDLDFKLMIAKIVGKLGVVGPLSVQGFRSGGEIKIFEFNARFTGAQIVRAMGGVNSPEILIDNWLDGVKSYPTIPKKFIALWYADYYYVPYIGYENLKTFKKTVRRDNGVALL
jgi:carbamoyl-phosphate synthase large subunit